MISRMYSKASLCNSCSALERRWRWCSGRGVDAGKIDCDLYCCLFVVSVAAYEHVFPGPCCMKRWLWYWLSTKRLTFVDNLNAKRSAQQECTKGGVFFFVVVIIVCCLVLECKSNQSKWLPGLELSERMTERAERRQGFSTDWSVWSFSKWTKTPSQWGRSIEASKQK